jgi:hypothetical protein
MQSPLARLGAALLAFSALVSVAAWRKPPPPPPPVIEAPPPPPPTSLSSSVLQAAAAYEDYMHQASTLSPAFADGAQVESELKTGESYQPAQLAHGVVAYSAVVALQDPDFVAAVKVYAKDAAGRAQLANLIYSDPRYASQIPGAPAAAARIVDHLNADGVALQKAGAAIRQSAYDVQHQPWSKLFVADRDGRLAVAKQLGDTPAAPSIAESDFLLKVAVAGSGLDPAAPTAAAAAGAAVPAPITGGAAAVPAIIAPGSVPAPAAATVPVIAPPPYTEGVTRGLAIAALAVLGAAGDDNAAQVSALMNEGVGARCLDLAKLNHYQCLAVAKPHYEDMFCLGQHALFDTGRCLQKVAGTAAPEVLEVTRMDAEKAAKDAAAKARKGKPVHHKGRRRG